MTTAEATSSAGTPAARTNARLPTATRATVDRALDALAGLLAHIASVEPSVSSASTAARDERLAEHVRRHPIDRRGEPQQLPGSNAVAARISRTSGVPTVSVPVLSNRTVRAWPSVSIAPAPLTITPARAARESPETSAIGAARINGHGVATTTTASARIESPLSAHAAPATRASREERTRRSGRPCARTAPGAPGPARPTARAPRRRSRLPADPPAPQTASPRSPCR